MIALEFEEDKALSIAKHMEKVALRLRIEIAKKALQKHFTGRQGVFYTTEAKRLIEETQGLVDNDGHVSLLSLAALEKDGFIEEVPADLAKGSHTYGWKVSKPC